MAKTKQSENFKNCMIDLETRTITEITKDEEKVYSLDAFLERWDKVEVSSFGINKEVDIVPDGEED